MIKNLKAAYIRWAMRQMLADDARRKEKTK